MAEMPPLQPRSVSFHQNLVYFTCRPAGFEDSNTNSCNNGMIPDDMLPPSDDSDNDDIGDMVVNANRPQVMYEDTDSDSEDEIDDDEDDLESNDKDKGT